MGKINKLIIEIEYNTEDYIHETKHSVREVRQKDIFIINVKDEQGRCYELGPYEGYLIDYFEYCKDD